MLRSFVSKIIDKEFNISVINKIEILGHNTAGNAIEEFINMAYVFDLEKNIVAKTIKLRKEYKIKLPDAIIAATALENSLTLITRNIKDFKDINGLKVINPNNK